MEDGLSRSTTAAGAALLTVKKEPKPASMKRQERWERLRSKKAEEQAAIEASKEKERLAAIAQQANADLIAAQAAARAVLLLKGEVFAGAYAAAATLSPELTPSVESSVSSAKRRPPRTASPGLSTPSPAAANHRCRG